jgi:hypothetical protein
MGRPNCIPALGGYPAMVSTPSASSKVSSISFFF